LGPSAQVFEFQNSSIWSTLARRAAVMPTTAAAVPSCEVLVFVARERESGACVRVVCHYGGAPTGLGDADREKGTLSSILASSALRLAARHSRERAAQ
jgi:hypothetical protein